MTSSTSANEDVLTWREGAVGRIVLNRPRALNALNEPMVSRISAALSAWEPDETVRAVLITGAGERGLCAGGDIRAVYEDVISGGGAASRAFWRTEYYLNVHIARYSKPYVAMMDGIVMGGGVGISAHGSIRIVTERSTIAMPETGIGFVPDVGGTHLLARAPGEIGTHLALTSDAVGPGDAILCGLADHYLPSGQIDAFIATLIAHGDPADAVGRLAEPAPHGELAAQRDWIDTCYRADTVEEILARLEAADRPQATAAAERIRGNSPTAVKVTLRALRRARRFSTLEETVRQEYRVSCAGLERPDFVEGVRAQIVDKDRHPRWSPASLAQVTDADIEHCFASLGDEDLEFTPVLA